MAGGGDARRLAGARCGGLSVDVLLDQIAAQVAASTGLRPRWARFAFWSVIALAAAALIVLLTL